MMLKGVGTMRMIEVTRENIDTEHICCAITEKKDETCVADKKAWLRDRFDEGLVFKKMDIRAKVFIEYIPAENAWCPMEAPGYMHINCLWVSGQHKGKGYASELLQACIADARAKGKAGLTVLSAERKKPFLSDGKFLRHKGFLVADEAQPFFQLLYLPFSPEAPAPRFLEHAKSGRIAEQGMVVYYANQCPFANTYVQRAAALAARRGFPVTIHRLTSAEQAQQAPTPYTTYTFFHDGNYVTHEIMSELRFESYLDSHGMDWTVR